MNQTRVVNMRKDPYDVSIDRDTKWGNPYSHKPGTRAKYIVSTRAEAIQKYEEWIRTQPDLMAQLPELDGKVLGCHCKPKACHGDVLVKLIEDSKRWILE